MINKINSGYKHEAATNDYPNFWELNAYQYLIWGGAPRQKILSIGNVLGIFRFKAGSVAIHHIKGDLFATAELLEKYMKGDTATGLTNAFLFIKAQGTPRTYSPIWKMG